MFYFILPRDLSLSQLQSLSLGNISFYYAFPDAVKLLNVHRLKSLKLFDYENTDKLLTTISNGELFLTTFEIRDNNILAVLPALLILFKGLYYLKL